MIGNHEEISKRGVKAAVSPEMQVTVHVVIQLVKNILFPHHLGSVLLIHILDGRDDDVD